MDLEKLTDLMRSIASDEAEKRIKKEVESARQWGRDFDDAAHRKASALDDHMKDRWPIVAAVGLLCGIGGYVLRGFTG